MTTEEKKTEVKRALLKKALESGSLTKSPEPVQASAFDKYINKDQPILAGLAIGAVKGVGSTLAGASELFQKGAGLITSPIVKAITGKEPAPIGERPAGLEEALTAKTTAEKVGKTIEQIAEFVIPATKIAQAGKLLGIAGEIKNLPNFLKMLSSVIEGKAGTAAAANVGTLLKTTEGGLGTLAKVAGVEALAGGATAAAQAGDVNKQVAEIAAISGAFPIAGAAYAKLAPPIKELITRSIPSKLINSLIKPLSKEFRFGKDPGLALATENITGNSLKDVLGKTRNVKNIVGKELGSVIEKASTHSKILNVAEELNKVSQKFTTKVTDPNAAQKFQNIMDQIFNKVKFAEGKLEIVGTKDLTALDAKGVHDVQKLIGELTIWTGAPADKAVNKILAKMYRNLGKSLNEMAPGAKKLQQRWANLLGAEKSIEQRAAVIARTNAIMGLIPTISGFGIGTGALLSGKDLSDSAILGLLGLLIAKGAGTTAFKSRVAAGLASPLAEKGIETGLKIAPKATIGSVSQITQ